MGRRNTFSHFVQVSTVPREEMSNFSNHKSNVVVSIFEDPLLSRSIPTIAQTGVFMINIQAGNSFLSSALPSIPSILGSNRFRSCSLSVI